MQQYTKIIFLFDNGDTTKVNARVGSNLMKIAKENGIQQIEGICGGAKACATCHIILTRDVYNKLENNNTTKKTEEEEGMLDTAFKIEETSRLGCQVLVTHDMHNTQVRIP